MGKVLLIAEKPDAGRSIAAALLGRTFSGAGPHTGQLADGTFVTVVTARGHLVELAAPQSYDAKFAQWNPHDLPIVPPGRWEFQEVPRKEADNYLRTLGREVPAHVGEEIVNACDAGREGELIFRKALQASGGRLGPETRYSRLWAHSMTDEALREAFAKRAALSGYDGLAEAGYTRDQADWLVGMNATVLATKTLPRGRGDWRVWSVGRVQTPTLALVVERDLLIANFTPQPFWEAYGTFGEIEAKAEVEAYVESPDSAKLLGVPKIAAERTRKAFWEQARAAAFATAAMTPARYRASDKQSVRTANPPLLYDLQEMQKYFSKKFGRTASETLELLQKLYEAKLISYPRTDSRHLPADMKDKLYDDLARVLENLRETRPSLHLVTQPLPDRKLAQAARVFNDSKVSDHYGLVPTGVTAGLDALAGHELFAYLAILQSALMTLDAPAKFRVVTRRWVQEGATGPYAPAAFRAQREELEQPGFTRWQKKEPKEGEKNAPLPPLDGEPVTLAGVNLKELKTNPPDYFTDATLLDAMKFAGSSFDEALPEAELEAMIDVMKDRGIGTPATRAAIIEKLIARGFIERRKNSLLSTENGRLLCRELDGRAPSLLSAKLTAEWELVLKQMEKGRAELRREQFLDRLLEDVLRMKETFLRTTQRTVVNEPPVAVTAGTPVAEALCPKTQTPLLDRGPFYEAAGFPGVRLWKKSFGREFAAMEWVAFLTAQHAGKPYAATGMKTQTGREFAAELALDPATGKITFHQPEAKKVKGAKCPKTGRLLLDCGKWFEAEGWPGVRLYKNAFGRDFTATDYVAILTGWHNNAPEVVTGLVSRKTGQPYSARLVLDPETKRLKPDFGP